jgi:pilus assembly protein CpaE
MRIFLFTAGVESGDLEKLEGRVKTRLPTLQKLTKLEEITKQIAAHTNEPASETTFIIFPVLTTASSFDRLVSIAEQTQPGLFFIFVSKEISASDYKRLVRSGGADWVSLDNAPEEIHEIVTRASKTETTPAAHGAKPIIVGFLPSAGGVGNTSLAVETAIQVKLEKQNRNRRICLLDLDLQTSHVCDHLDIEPRLQLREIIDSPERLDGQLFDLFVSHHSSGLDVMASPRNRRTLIEPNVTALDALFGMIAPRYDLLILDFPSQWATWTPQILSVCDAVIVTGLNTVPGLRQVSDTLAAVRSIDRIPPKIAVGLNRCEARLLGGVARSQHIARLLGGETVMNVRDDVGAAIEAANTGVPISVASPSSKIAKDVRSLASMVGSIARPET